MLIASLVPCPDCHKRRDLKSIGPAPDGTGEVRTFYCPECDETMNYLFRGRGEPIMIPPKKL